MDAGIVPSRTSQIGDLVALLRAWNWIETGPVVVSAIKRRTRQVRGNWSVGMETNPYQVLLDNLSCKLYQTASHSSL